MSTLINVNFKTGNKKKREKKHVRRSSDIEVVGWVKIDNRDCCCMSQVEIIWNDSRDRNVKETKFISDLLARLFMNVSITLKRFNCNVCIFNSLLDNWLHRTQ